MTIVQQTIQSFVDQTVAKVLVYIHSKYDPKFDPIIRISFSGSRSRSWGGKRRGKPFISLALLSYAGMSNAHTFREYKSFEHDPEIGSVKSSQWQKCLAALIVHEIGHALQYSVSVKDISAALSVDTDEFETTRGHCELWKTIYRDLRKVFVNGVEFSDDIVITADAAKTRERQLVRDTTGNKNRKWTKKTTKAGKTWFHRYYDADGDFIVLLAERPGKSIHYHDEPRVTHELQWKWLDTISLKEARANFGI